MGQLPDNNMVYLIFESAAFHIHLLMEELHNHHLMLWDEP